MKVLNRVWKIIAKMTDIEHYLDIAQVYIAYVLQHCPPRDVNVMLGDILNHVRPAPQLAKHQAPLAEILIQVANTRCIEFGTLISMVRECMVSLVFKELTK